MEVGDLKLNIVSPDLATRLGQPKSVTQYKSDLWQIKLDPDKSQLQGHSI